MTELEIMQRAKMYIDKLANGIDPLTDQPVPEGDTVNNVRIARCLFYVSDVLRQVIENGGHVIRAGKLDKIPFSVTQEDLQNFQFSNKPISVSEITRRINALVDTETMTKMKYSAITEFLTNCGFLEQRENEFGKKSRFPTDEGFALGISTEVRISENGPYRVTIYDRTAQQFILDHLEAILETKDSKTE